MFKFIKKIADKFIKPKQVVAIDYSNGEDYTVISRAHKNDSGVVVFDNVEAFDSKNKISKYHMRLIKIGYTLEGAKRFGRIQHIYKHTKSQRIRKKVYMKLKDID